MVYAAAPLTEFASARADLEGHYLRALDPVWRSGRAGPQRHQGRTAPHHAAPAEHVPEAARCRIGGSRRRGHRHGLVLGAVKGTRLGEGRRSMRKMTASAGSAVFLVIAPCSPSERDQSEWQIEWQIVLAKALSGDNTAG